MLMTKEYDVKDLYEQLTKYIYISCKLYVFIVVAHKFMNMFALSLLTCHVKI